VAAILYIVGALSLFLLGASVVATIALSGRAFREPDRRRGRGDGEA
jgi:hypothetical protein